MKAKPTGPAPGHLSSRQIEKQFGISRPKQWRAKQLANIPEEELEALIEGDNPPTVTALVNYAHSTTNHRTSIGLRNLIRSWNRASASEQDAFLDWISGLR